jgi:hypothetical protein
MRTSSPASRKTAFRHASQHQDSRSLAGGSGTDPGPGIRFPPAVSLQRTVLPAGSDCLRKLLLPSVAQWQWIDRRRLQAIQFLSVQFSGDVAA